MLSFTATASNFPGTVSYAWDFGDSGGGGTGGGGGGGGGGGNCPPVVPNCAAPLMGDTVVQALTPGPATNTHTYAAAGTYTVTVQATSGSTSKTATKSISIGTGGPPPPLNTFDVTGATFNPFNNTWSAAAGIPIHFTAGDTDSTTAFAWDFGDGATLAASTTNRVATHTFVSAGSFTVTMTASNANGTSRAPCGSPSARRVSRPS